MLNVSSLTARDSHVESQRRGISLCLLQCTSWLGRTSQAKRRDII
ncbi:hypothetical protein Nmel_011249 [Mimus melanotis]